MLPWIAVRDSGARTGTKSRLPDLCVFTTEQDSLLINESAVFQTPLLLAVEVVSPEFIERNYRFKRSLLAALLIPEYWIIDPVEDVTVLLLVRDFMIRIRLQKRIVSQTFSELALTAEQVLQPGTIAL